ncbi:MAG: hypothetical protein AMXMBFR48_28920 [Ignavibacteriales bacterium]
MKRLYILLVLLSYSSVLYSQWKWINPYHASTVVIKIQAVSSYTIWALGAYGNLMKSQDGGLTWSVQRPDISVDISDMWFVDSLKGFITGNSGYLYKTTDGGAVWTSHQIYPDLDLTYISFNGPSVGYISGRTGGILKTTDGGNTWTYKSAVSGTSRAMVFFNEQQGLLAYDFGKIARTSDGGNTWQTGTTGFSGNLDYIKSLQWAGGSRAFAIDRRSRLFASADSGKTWQQKTVAQSFTPFVMSFTDTLNGVVIDYSMKWAITTDGGVTFQTRSPITSLYEPQAVQFYDSSRIFVSGPRSELFLTSNAGQSWHFSESQPDIQFNALAPYNGDNGFVAGNNGLLAVYDHSFAQVTRQRSATRKHLYAISFDGYTKGIAVGENGEVVFSKMSSLVSWNRSSTGFSNHLYSIATFASSDTVFAAGEGGVILRSSNYGVSWEQQLSGITTNLRAIKYFDLNNLIAVGDNGVILKSSDAGATWHLVPSNTTLKLNSVSGGASNRLISGAHGLVLRSSDNGNSWSRVVITDTSEIAGVSNMTQNSARLVTQSGIVYNTTNAGQSWSRELINSEVKYTAITTYTPAIQAILYYPKGLLSYYAVVPVELTAFTAVVHVSNITLNWQTASELNNRGFEVQRSSDGETWLTVGFKQGNGTTIETSFYTFTDENPLTGKNYYRLKQTDYDGQSEYLETVTVEFKGEFAFALEQNYPNPFNPVTNITYALPASGVVLLQIYNTNGEEVASLVNEFQEAGRYSVRFNAAAHASGTYLYRIMVHSEAGVFTRSRKMMFLK